MFGPGLVARLATLSIPVALAVPWEPNQVSTRICQWKQLRGEPGGPGDYDALLLTSVQPPSYVTRSTWTAGIYSGSQGTPTALRDCQPRTVSLRRALTSKGGSDIDNSPDNLDGVIYTLNFSTPFNTTQNISAILGTLETGGGGANSRAPTYLDGALLGNDAHFCLYGGMTWRSSSSPDPPEDTILCYEAYQYGPERGHFKPGFFDRELGENVTRHVAYGGAASAPSENLAWYFSGLRSPTWGNIYTPTTATRSTSADTVSNRLITIDVADRLDVTFTNDTLPSIIPGRANPELVWVPVGSRGILVALGGVVYPDWVNETTTTSANETASVSSSPLILLPCALLGQSNPKIAERTKSRVYVYHRHLRR